MNLNKMHLYGLVYIEFQRDCMSIFYIFFLAMCLGKLYGRPGGKVAQKSGRLRLSIKSKRKLEVTLVTRALLVIIS